MAARIVKLVSLGSSGLLSIYGGAGNSGIPGNRNKFLRAGEGVRLPRQTQRTQRSKKFDLDRNFQSRSKFLITYPEGPTIKKIWSRSKFSISLASLKSRDFAALLGKWEVGPEFSVEALGGPTRPSQPDLPLWPQHPPNTSSRTWFGPEFDSAKTKRGRERKCHDNLRQPSRQFTTWSRQLATFYDNFRFFVPLT